MADEVFFDSDAESPKGTKRLEEHTVNNRFGGGDVGGAPIKSMIYTVSCIASCFIYHIPYISYDI